MLCPQNCIGNILPRLLRIVDTTKVPNILIPSRGGIALKKERCSYICLPCNAPHEPPKDFDSFLSHLALVRVDPQQSDRLRTNALPALGDLTLNIGCIASTAATCPSLTVRSPMGSSHVQPKHVHLQLSHHYPQFLHFLPFVDHCPRWLCLLLALCIQLPPALTQSTLVSKGRLYPQLSIAVASQHAPQSHVKLSHQPTAVQQPRRLAVTTSSSPVLHGLLRLSPHKSCIRLAWVVLHPLLLAP